MNKLSNMKNELKKKSEEIENEKLKNENLHSKVGFTKILNSKFILELTQKNEKIDLLENITRNTLDFQLIRNLQLELDDKTQKLEQYQKNNKRKLYKNGRSRNMTMSSITRKSLFFTNNPNLNKLRTSISRQSNKCVKLTKVSRRGSRLGSRKSSLLNEKNEVKNEFNLIEEENIEIRAKRKTNRGTNLSMINT